MAETEQEVDFTKLSIEDRCVHKNWKARVSGYEELTNVFQTQTNDKSNEFSKYASLMKKFVIDSNAAAQEKGLSAVLAFIENYAHAGKVVAEVIAGLIAKCLISPKVKTRELALEIVLMSVEIEKFDVVLEELMKGLDNKTPKVVVSCITLIKECLKNFGVKVISVKPIVKVIPRLLEDRDKNVREEGKSLAVEVYRWIKDAIKPQLQNLKPVQLQELESGFEKEKDERAVPLRYLRSQQDRQDVEAVVDTVDSAVAPAEVEDATIDPFDLLDPVDIISKLPADFYELCEAKKWQERKEALETLQKLIDDNPKLQTGDYADLVKQLKKFIGKDNNVVVVAAAAKCMAGIAKGLRKSFYPYSHACISTILEKFKEKKAAVVTGLREAIDAIIVSTTLEAISEDITTALDNKNPQIKSETALFLVRTFAVTHQSAINKKLLKTLCDALMKSLNDMDATVRESSAEALGTLMKVVGEKAISPFIQGVDEIKMKKVKECFDKAEVKFTASNAPPPAPSKPPAVKRPASSSAASSAAPKSVPKKTTSTSSIASSKSGSSEELDMHKKVAPKKAIQSKSGSKVNEAKPKETESKTSARPSKPGTAKAGSARTLTRQPLSAGVSKKKEEEVSNAQMIPLNKMKDQRIADEKALRVLKWNFTAPRDEFYTQLKEQMISAEWNITLISYCFHSDFKFHIKAIDQMKDYVSKGEVETIIANSDLILRWIAIRFFDTNPSVILKALELLTLIFDGYRQMNIPLSDADANSFIPYLVIKSGDPKDAVRNKVHDIVAKIREIHPPAKLFTHLMTGLQSKNARQRATCLDELANLIELCGMSVCQQPSAAVTMKEIAKFIADRDNSVRNAALNCAVQVYFLEGEKVYKYVGNLSDKELGLLEERIKRASKNRVVVPQAQPTPVVPPTSVMSGRKMTPEKNGGRRSPSPDMEMEQSPPQRRMTPPKINSSLQAKSQMRPKSIGPLSLDMDEYESQQQQMGPTVGFNSHMRERTNFASKASRMNHQRIDMKGEHDMAVHEILNMPDVNIRKSSVKPATGSMTKMINSSPKVDDAINLVMAQMSSQDIHSALDSLAQLDKLLEDDDKAHAALISKVDHLITICYMHYRLIITKHLTDESLSKTEVVRLFRAVTSVLTSLFSKPFLAKKATRDILKELMSHMISLLVDIQLTQLSDSQNIIKSLNNLITQVIATSDSTNILSALIKLLHDCLSGSINASTKFTEMVMKCLWKISRNIETYFDSIDIDKILADVHAFLKAFPSSWWKEGGRTDTPLRTIKTLTYLIVQHSGESVFDHLTLIPDRNESELYHYLHKALRQTAKLPSTPKGTNSNSGVSQLSPKDAQTQLSAIIGKLGTDDDLKALNELYEFTQSNPKVSVESCLEKSSENFRSYVLSALQKMKEQKHGQSSLHSSSRIPAANSFANSSKTSSSGLKGAVLPQLQWSESLTPEDVIDWYKQVARTLGFDASKYDDPAFLSRVMNGNSGTGNPMSEGDTQMAVQRAQQTLDNFKMICNAKNK